MLRSGLAVLSLVLGLALAPRADAVLTPSGTIQWTLSAGSFDISIEVYQGSGIGPMTVLNHANGRTAVGSLYPAAVIDRPHGQIDELTADASFQNEAFFPMLGLGDITPGSNPSQGHVMVSLIDVQGIAFDGAGPSLGGELSVLPVDQPPLSVFESGSVTITHFEFSAALGGFAPITQVLPITGLVPEPSLALLLLPLVALAAARARLTLRGR